MNRRVRCAGERGVTIVEAAFVLPILFLFVLGMIDVGLWEFQSTQASGAARDGARTGVISYKSAQGSTASPGGTDFTSINNAVRARLGNQTYSLTVSCIEPDSDTALTCSTAEPDSDRIKVIVTWNRSATSPLGGALIPRIQTVTGTAVMQLVGKPS